MNNVKFLYLRPEGYMKPWTSSSKVELVFEICPKIADYLRNHSKCPKYRLNTILDDNNFYYVDYPMEHYKLNEQRAYDFIRKVEWLGNEHDYGYLLNQIIDDQYRQSLVSGDVDDDETWRVYGFFYGLARLLIDNWDD